MANIAITIALAAMQSTTGDVSAPVHIPMISVYTVEPMHKLQHKNSSMDIRGLNLMEVVARYMITLYQHQLHLDESPESLPPANFSIQLLWDCQHLYYMALDAFHNKGMISASIGILEN